MCVIQIRWDASPSRHLDDVVLTIVRRCSAAAGKSPQTISGTRRWASARSNSATSVICVPACCVPLVRRVLAEDLTQDKTDEKDAVLIARLTLQLRCYEPEPVDEIWGRLRHLGARREQLITEISGQVQQMRDLLECVWPAAFDTAQQPFRSGTWIAALTVIVDRDGGDLARTRRLRPARFEHAVRRQILQRGRQKPRTVALRHAWRRSKINKPSDQPPSPACRNPQAFVVNAVDTHRLTTSPRGAAFAMAIAR